jgi:molecular chaperone GrpE
MSEEKNTNEEINEQEVNQHAETGSETVETTTEQTPEEKIAELNDKFLRLYSEFDNYRKRTNKEKVDLISSANAGIL